MKKPNFKPALILSAILLSACAQSPERLSPAPIECPVYQKPSPEVMQSVKPDYRQRLETLFKAFEKALYESDQKPTNSP